MHDHSTIDQNGQSLFGENTTAGDFRQIFGRIASRIGNTKLQLKASRESASPSAESQLAATQEALARAHVSLVQLGLELDSERRSRQSAECDARDERLLRCLTTELEGAPAQGMRVAIVYGARHMRTVIRDLTRRGFYCGEAKWLTVFKS